MPFYVYQNDAGHRIERFCSMQSTPPSAVDHLSFRYHRVYLAPPVIYNCKGFYTTDTMNSIDAWRKENLRGD